MNTECLANRVCASNIELISAKETTSRVKLANILWRKTLETLGA